MKILQLEDSEVGNIRNFKNYVFTTYRNMLLNRIKRDGRMVLVENIKQVFEDFQREWHNID